MDMHKSYCHICLILFLLISFPEIVQAQSAWKKTIELQDRRKESSPVVANIDLSAYILKSRVDIGSPAMMDADEDGLPINFGNINEGYVKFKIDKITWIDSTYDGSRDFKVIVRSLWVDMNPPIWTEIRVPGRTPDQLKRQFINSPNVEYVKGDSLPPPFIFKINRNGNFTFTMGFKTLTPETKLEKPFPYEFRFRVTGMLRDAPVSEEPPPEVIDTFIPPPVTTEVAPEVPEEEPDYSDIDRAVAIARESEDTDRLISLIGDYPDVPSVKDARGDLAIFIRRELVDSMKYRIDLRFQKFSNALPKRDQLDISFVRNDQPLEGINRPFTQWVDDRLFVRPPRDGRDYQMIANIRATPENKSDIILNSLKDYIRFAYKDTLEEASVKFKLSGGTSPFTLKLEKKSGDQFVNVDGGILVYGDTVFSKERFVKSFDLPDEGDYRVFVEDADQLRKTGIGTIHLVPPPPIPPFVWYIVGTGLLIFVLGYILWARGQRKKAEEMEALISGMGGLDPRVKRKPKPDLKSFWTETAISDLSLHKVFIDELAVYLKERPDIPPGSKPVIEGVLLGTIVKFDFENEQYEVRIDRFRSIDPRSLDHYDDAPDREKWTEIKELLEDHPDLVKIGWLQVVQDQPMRLSEDELQFQDEQFSELFQLLLKIDLKEEKKLCGFFTRTISGKVNNSEDRKEGVDHWMDWDKIEYAGYYENEEKPVKQATDTIKIKNMNQAEWV